MSPFKRIIIILSLIVIAFPASMIHAADPQLSDEMAIFLQSCSFLNHGIELNDEALLADAAEGFGEVGVLELEESKVKIEATSQKAVKLPEIQYNAEFIDILRKANFEIVERAPLAVDRSILDTDLISTVSRSIGPNETLTIFFSGYGEMEVSLPSQSPGELTLEIESEGKPVNVNTDAPSGFPYAVWNIDGNSDAPISVKVNNPSDKRVSFAVAMK